MNDRVMKDVKELRDKLIEELKSIYDEKEAISITRFLLGSFGINGLVADPDLVVNAEMEKKISVALSELLEYKPIQYVCGKAYFYNLELEVNPSVLIPRPETEELVYWIVNEHLGRKALKILDIGTGSGCIILALGNLLTTPHLTAIDISEEALSTAQRNAMRLGILVNYHRINILDEGEWTLRDRFDVIVSNPPYVREKEKTAMQVNVLDYEPASALFVPDEDPLLYYRAIAKFGRWFLEKEGHLYLEINEELGKEVVELVENEGYTDISLKKDFQGKDRMVRAHMRI